MDKICYNCGRVMTEVEPDYWRCQHCDWSDEWMPDDEDECLPPESGQGFYTEVDGQVIHVLGEAGMSEETLEALKELARLAMKAVDENTLLDSDENEA